MSTEQICPRCHIVCDERSFNAHLWDHCMSDGTPHDPTHADTCDWNLYAAQRALGAASCNLGCVDA